jgi:hypothetical protein
MPRTTRGGHLGTINAPLCREILTGHVAHMILRGLVRWANCARVLFNLGAQSPRRRSRRIDHDETKARAWLLRVAGASTMGRSRSESSAVTSQAKQGALVTDNLGNLRWCRDGESREVSSGRDYRRSWAAHTKRLNGAASDARDKRTCA